MSPRKIIIFEEGCEILKTGIAKLQNIVEELEPNFTAEEHMKLYMTVFNLCTTDNPPSHALEVYQKYKEACEEYIRSKVLPSLQGKKDDLFLRELLKRWSNYQVMTKRLSKFFCCLESQDIPRFSLPSLKETGFRSFYHLVYEGMNKEIMDAIFDMMEWKRAGKMTDQTFVVNILDFYFEFYKWTKEVNTRRNINLISSDLDVFEVDYGLAFMSKSFGEITMTVSVGQSDAIYVPKVSGKMLGMVVDYYKKHKHTHQSELMDWDAQFVDVDPKTLFDLATTARYMKIVSLEELAWNKLGELIKDETPEQISQILCE